MNKSRFLALMSMIAAGAAAPLQAFPALLKRAPKARKPHPMMVTAPAHEIAEWNRQVVQAKRAKKMAKIDRRAQAMFSLLTEGYKPHKASADAAIKQRMSELAGS